MKRYVLFVDDDPNILLGIKRIMRPYSNDWEVHTVTSGDEALSLMEKISFDCVVSDMRMPGMDGAQLLSHIQKLYPHTARFILSGYAEAEAIIQALSVTHQFLAKPCDSSKIIESIKRACDIHTLINDHNLKKLIGKIGTLPARPTIYNKLLAALNDNYTSVDIISAIIEQDIAITAKILHIINSAFFGLPQAITNIRDATAYLGINMIRNLVLIESIFKSFNAKIKFNGFSLDDEYKKSILSAGLAKKLVTGQRESDEAYLAGMLQNIGRLVMAQYLPDQFRNILADVNKTNVSLEMIELRHIGSTHAKIGGYLLSLWGFPYPILEAVSFCEKPWEIEHSSFQSLDAIYIANCLIDEISDKDNNKRTINLKYLDKLCVSDQLPGWRTLATAHFQTEQEKNAHAC